MKKVVVLLVVLTVLFLYAALRANPSYGSSGTIGCSGNYGSRYSGRDEVDVGKEVESQAGQQEGKGIISPSSMAACTILRPRRFGAQQAAMDWAFPPNVTSPQDWDQTQQNAIIDGLVAGGVNGIGMFTSDAVAGNEKISGSLIWVYP